MVQAGNKDFIIPVGMRLVLKDMLLTACWVEGAVHAPLSNVYLNLSSSTDQHGSSRPTTSKLQPLAHSLHLFPAHFLLLHDLEGPEGEEQHGRLSEAYPTVLRASGISIGREPTSAVKIMDLAMLPDLCPGLPGPTGTALSHYVYCGQALEWRDSFH